MKATGAIYANTKRTQVDRSGPPCGHVMLRIASSNDPDCPPYVIVEKEYGSGELGSWICGADTEREMKRIWDRCFEL